MGQADALLSPIGIGLGRLSSASRADENSTIDNGYLIVLGELGLVGMGLLVWVLVWLTRQSRRRDISFLAMLLVTSAGSFIFGNLPGLLLWTLAGSGHGVEEGNDMAVTEARRPSTAVDQRRG